jgi:hypothetical protein
MSKMYVKDPNGKYRLVDTERQPLTLEALDIRLRRVESIVIGPQK